MTIRKKSINMRLIFLAAFFIGLIVPNVYAKDYCDNCHKDVKFRVQNKSLYDYYNYWRDSVHETARIICTDCHGGDETKADKDVAHKTKNFSSLTAMGEAAYKKIPEVCGKCHKEVLKNFLKSEHYKLLMQEKKSPNCVTCHGSMNTEIYEAHNIAKGCSSCHNKENKQTPEVGEKAENLLTYINFIRAYRKWIAINYSDEQPKMVKETNKQYKNIVFSWHQFDFTQMDEKTMKLLIDLRAIVNKGMAEKRKKKRS
jgi:hypothetical protein